MIKHYTMGMIDGRRGSNRTAPAIARAEYVDRIHRRPPAVIGSEDSSDIVFALAGPNIYSRRIGAASAFWGEFDKTTGDYVPGSARFIDATERDSISVLEGSAIYAHAGGQPAIQAQLRKESQPVDETFTIGADGPNALTVIATRSTVAFIKLDENGDPIFAGNLGTPRLFGDGRSRARWRSVRRRARRQRTVRQFRSDGDLPRARPRSIMSAAAVISPRSLPTARCWPKSYFP